MSARLAVDIGGTFTDLALWRGNERFSAKVLTTSSAPEQGVMTGVATQRTAGAGAHDEWQPSPGSTNASGLLAPRPFWGASGWDVPFASAESGRFSRA